MISYCMKIKQGDNERERDYLFACGKLYKTSNGIFFVHQGMRKKISHEGGEVEDEGGGGAERGGGTTIESAGVIVHGKYNSACACVCVYTTFLVWENLGRLRENKQRCVYIYPTTKKAGVCACACVHVCVCV